MATFTLNQITTFFLLYTHLINVHRSIAQLFTTQTKNGFQKSWLRHRKQLIISHLIFLYHIYGIVLLHNKKKKQNV